MEIAIFESVVIESALIELEAESKKYDGLYVDMNNAPERKYVKDKAALIAGLKKKVDRVRIDSAKDYKCEVESQALAIQTRLDDANSNFQVLIDDYAAERKVIIDAEKARKQAILDAAQLENDHELGLLMNQSYVADRAEALRLQVEQEKRLVIEREQYAAEQVKLAVARNEVRIEYENQNNINAENARLANKEHLRGINIRAVNDIMGCGADYETAKAIVTALANNSIKNITINY